MAATILQMLLHAVRNALMRLLAALIVHVSVHIFLVICMRIQAMSCMASLMRTRREAIDGSLRCNC